MPFVRWLVALMLVVCASPNLLAAKNNGPRVAVFADAGVGRSGISNVISQLSAVGIDATQIKGNEIARGGLKKYDVVVFSGGSGSKQSQALGDRGREEVRQFVRKGGGYIGICAGGYLACSGFDWGLGVLNARTADSRWRRGEGIVKMEVTDDAKKMIGLPGGTHNVRYANGPILVRDEKPNIPPFQPLAYFRTELSQNGTPKDLMVNTPAIVSARYGKGRVIVSSPHPESTPSLTPSFVPSAVRWAVESAAATQLTTRR